MPGPQILVKNQDTARWEACFSYFTKKILHRKNSTIDSIIIELDANRILSHVAPIFLDNGYFFANFQNKIFLEDIYQGHSTWTRTAPRRIAAADQQGAAWSRMNDVLSPVYGAVGCVRC